MSRIYRYCRWLHINVYRANPKDTYSGYTVGNALYWTILAPIALLLNLCDKIIRSEYRSDSKRSKCRKS